MKERPILFSAPMVRAILDRSKTQTRRVVKPQPVFEGKRSYGDSWAWKRTADDWFSGVTTEQLTGPHGLMFEHRAYAHPGDRLWVKETWQALWANHDKAPHSLKSPDGWAIGYVATDGIQEFRDEERGLVTTCKPSIFMPRWASRVLLDVVSVRIERLQDISEADARAEGVTVGDHINHRTAFFALWESLNGKRPGCSVQANPWVYAVGFEPTGGVIAS